MTSYIVTFVVYTTAMVGAIFLALFVYKKFALNKNFSSESKFLKVEDCVNLGVRKQLYVVRAGGEKFLIASDAERTTFLAKLEANSNKKVEIDFFKPEKTRETNIKDDETQFLNDIYKPSKDAGEILHNIVNSGGKQ